MAQIVVRKLEESVKAALKRRAKRHGRSAEAEAREILRAALVEEKSPNLGLGSRIAARFAGHGLKEPIEELRGSPARPAEFGK